MRDWGFAGDYVEAMWRMLRYGWAAAALGWRPKVSFAELVAMMVDSDLDLAARELSLRDNGHAAVHVG